MPMTTAWHLDALVADLRASAAFSMKRDIQRAARAFGPKGVSVHARAHPVGGRDIHNGDDAAAIPDGDGWILLAAEGMLPSFIRHDPYFAGYCSVMVNVSDIAAMGGRPLAVVDVLYAGAEAATAELLRGMAVAADTFGVPVVGGHTSRLGEDSVLAVAIVGRASALITSFDARPGQFVLIAADLRGRFRDPEGTNFDAATQTAPAELRSLSILPAELAEAGLVRAGKDISMAGLLGTLVMLLESSGCGARVDLERIPIPKGTGMNRWLRAFPSYGYVFAVDPSCAGAVCDRFEAHGIACRAVGEVCEAPALTVVSGGQSAVFWDLRREGLTGFGPPKGGPRA